jgi:hypothetical protein
MADRKRRLYEYQCYVSADLPRHRSGFPAHHEERVIKMMDALFSDPVAMGPVVGVRAKHGNTANPRRGGFDATFCVAASSIMAATMTAVCALRNALDRAECDDLDVSGIELRRFNMPGGGYRATVVDAAI